MEFNDDMRKCPSQPVFDLSQEFPTKARQACESMSKLCIGRWNESLHRIRNEFKEQAL